MESLLIDPLVRRDPESEELEWNWNWTQDLFLISVVLQAIFTVWGFSAVGSNKGKPAGGLFILAILGLILTAIAGYRYFADDEPAPGSTPGMWVAIIAVIISQLFTAITFQQFSGASQA